MVQRKQFETILQWKLSRNKSIFELYEKRYDTYKGLKRFFGTVPQNAKVETQDLVSFRWKFEEYFLLFGADIHEYVQQVLIEMPLLKNKMKF